MFKFKLEKFEIEENDQNDQNDENDENNEIEWYTLECEIDFNSKDFEKAVLQAKEKSIHIMNASQDGSYRSPEMKYNMQLMGIIAEMACVSYLQAIVKRAKLNESVEVIRYDDVRTDEFKSPENEFDIKIFNKEDNTTLLVESRSSITHNRSFKDGLEKYDIIGSYTSVAKTGEADNDFYLRPLYRYLDFEKKNYSKLRFEEFLKTGKIELYLVAGCTIEEIITKGHLKSMSQSGTNYRVLPIKLSDDIVKFSVKLIDKLKN